MRNAFDLAAASGDVEVPPPGRLAKDAAYEREDFTNSNQSNVLAGGTGTNIYTTFEVGAPGILRQQAAAVATPDRAVVVPATSVVTSMILGGGAITFESRCRTVQAQDAVDQWSDRWGMSDVTAATDANDGVYFESNRAVNGDNDVRLCASVGGVRTKTTLGVAPTANTFERWKFVANAAGSSVQAYKNGVAVGVPVTTNLPSIGSSFACWWGQLIKTLGATSRAVDRDFFEVYQEFDPAR